MDPTEDLWKVFLLAQFDSVSLAGLWRVACVHLAFSCEGSVFVPFVCCLSRTNTLCIKPVYRVLIHLFSDILWWLIVSLSKCNIALHEPTKTHTHRRDLFSRTTNYYVETHIFFFDSHSIIILISIECFYFFIFVHLPYFPFVKYN